MTGETMGKTAWITVALAASLAGVAFAADDDLEVVKRATQASPQVEAAPAPPAAKVGKARPAERAERPTWFKVEVVDKLSGKRRVSVNLPIALVEAFGDDVPVRWGCGEKAAPKDHCGLKLKETLALLQKGQPLVEIEQETERIKVWVE